MKEKIDGLTAFPPRAGHFSADPMTMIGLTALILVLKTAVDIERDKTGKWKIHIKSKAADKAVIAEFVKKLLSWIPSGPFGK